VSDALKVSERIVARTAERLEAVTATAEADAIEEDIYDPGVWRTVLPAHKSEINRLFQATRERLAA
jgi:hypothetical protein